MTLAAITPEEVTAKKLKTIPPVVIAIFNKMIVENFDEGQAILYQDEVVTNILTKIEVDRDTVFDKGWLNIEKIYEKAGWKVIYDKPPYNESYRAHFVFRPKNEFRTEK